MSDKLLCWRNKQHDLTKVENFSKLVQEGLIECCGLKHTIFEVAPNRYEVIYAMEGERRLNKPEWK